MRYQGYYTDGKSSARVEVWIQPVGEGLRLLSTGGDPLEDWPYQGLRLLEEAYPGRPVRLRHRNRGEATLTLETPELLDALEKRTRRRLRGHWLFRPTGAAVGLWMVLLVGILIGVGWGLPRLVAPLSQLIPASWEKPLGEKVAGMISMGQPFCTGETDRAIQGQTALDKLTERLLEAGLHDGRELPYPVRVRVSPLAVVNAFAAPGGEVVLMEGLIAKAESPEEVAGVLAHELAHSLERHPLQGLVRSMGLRLVFALLLGDSTALDTLAGQIGEAAVLFSYTRADELEADRIGMELLNRANIRGDGLLVFFQRMRKAEGDEGGLPALLSTHPVHEERIAVIRANARGTGPALSSEEWEALRNICDKK